jgi:hypothetical protein
VTDGKYGNDDAHVSEENFRIKAEVFRATRDGRRTEFGRRLLDIMIGMSYQRDTTQSKSELAESVGLFWLILRGSGYVNPSWALFEIGS